MNLDLDLKELYTRYPIPDMSYILCYVCNLNVSTKAIRYVCIDSPNCGICRTCYKNLPKFLDYPDDYNKYYDSIEIGFDKQTGKITDKLNSDTVIRTFSNLTFK